MSSVQYLYVFWLTLFIFTLPSNLFLKGGESQAYIQGLLVDYLIPKLYLNDLALAGWLGTWVIETFSHWLKRRQFKLKMPTSTLTLMGILILLVATQLTTSHPFISSLQLIKLLMVFPIAAITVQSLPRIPQWLIPSAVLCTITFQSLLGLYQFIYQKAFYGYVFLGEPQLERSIGIAKTSWQGRELIIPYGTTPHPNVLGGFLALSCLFLTLTWSQGRFKHWPNWSKLFMVSGVSLALITLFLTQSWSAWLSLGVGWGLLLVKKISPLWWSRLTTPSITLAVTSIAMIATPLMIAHLATIFPENLSLVRRAELNQAAVTIFMDRPLSGVGLGTFTAHLEKYAVSTKIVRFVQPAHHLGLLWLAETGWLGAALICLGVYHWWRKAGHSKLKPLWLFILALIPVFALDHYVVTFPTYIWFTALITAAAISSDSGSSK